MRPKKCQHRDTPEDPRDIQRLYGRDLARSFSAFTTKAFL